MQFSKFSLRGGVLVVLGLLAGQPLAAQTPDLSCPGATGREATVVLPKEALAALPIQEGWLVVSTEATACVGRAALTSDLRTLTIHGDDPLTSSADGARPGDVLEFHLLDAQGMPIPVSFSLVLNPDACYGCQGTFTYDHDGVIIVSQLTLDASTPVEAEAPHADRVSLPYPSPTAARAAIDVQLTTQQPVRVVVYDALGREVARAHDASMPAGTSSVELPVSHLPSGTYLVRVSAATLAQTHPLVVVR